VIKQDSQGKPQSAFIVLRGRRTAILTSEPIVRLLEDCQLRHFVNARRRTKKLFEGISPSILQTREPL
jgi:hypothetical protein